MMMPALAIEDVEPAQAVLDRAHHLLDVAGPGDVGLDGGALAAELADLTGGDGELGVGAERVDRDAVLALRDVRDLDVAAGVREPDRDGPPDPARRARHERHLPFELHRRDLGRGPGARP
jgi:hypothetical protein